MVVKNCTPTAGLSLTAKLKHKVVIQQVTETRDAFGEPVESWATFKTRRASIEPLNGREYFRSKQTDSDVSVRIRLRYVAGITTKMRVSWTKGSTTRIYDIESVINPREENREIILMCTENAP